MQTHNEPFERCERAYEVEVEVPPGECRDARTLFSDADPESGIPGYPETRVLKDYGVEFPFTISYIDVHPECAPYFTVMSCTVGQWASWSCRDGVSPEILAARPKIKFRQADRGNTIHLTVRNNTGECRTFRARLVGTEERPVSKPRITP